MHLAKTIPALTFLSFFTINAQSQTPDRSASDGANEVYTLTTRAVAVGMDKSEVLERLGQPAAKLTPSIWAYPMASARTRRAGETLVVFLRNDRVQTLFVGNEAELAALTTDLREQVSRAYAVAAK